MDISSNELKKQTQITFKIKQGIFQLWVSRPSYKYLNKTLKECLYKLINENAFFPKEKAHFLFPHPLSLFSDVDDFPHPSGRLNNDTDSASNQTNKGNKKYI